MLMGVSATWILVIEDQKICRAFAANSPYGSKPMKGLI
jgi:hypothetical protein